MYGMHKDKCGLPLDQWLAVLIVFTFLRTRRCVGDERETLDLNFEANR